MTRVGRILQQTLLLAVATSLPAASQQPLQFKADVKMTSGSDGTRSTGTMYFGGTKTRTELTADGQSMIVLADPVAKSQYIIMPSEKVYMQMPIGQGPVSVPITGPSDPTNPCTGGSGNTDCVKGANEAVNGHNAVRWDYTSGEGVRTRAWVSTQLRFPVKLEDDDGVAMEFSNIAVGPQAASLFGIPADYKKMDMGGMDAISGGRGRSNSSDPIAAALANLPPEAAAALAAARRGEGGRGGERGRGSMGAAIPTGSAWERTKGWVVNMTVTATGSLTLNHTSSTQRETYTAKIVASLPLNYGTPSVGVPGAPGPRWQFIQGEDMGTPEALATPISFNLEMSGRIETSSKGACSIAEDSYSAVGIVKASGQKRAPMMPKVDGLSAMGVFNISPDLKTFDLLAAAGGLEIKETTDTRTDGKSCLDGKAYTKNASASQAAQYTAQIDVKGLPLPSAVGPISGTLQMPMVLGGHKMDATVNWTISPIR